MNKYKLVSPLRRNELSPLRKADQDSRTVPLPLMTSDEEDFRVFQILNLACLKWILHLVPFQNLFV